MAVEVLGHAFFIEDGAEWDNTLRGNLGMLVGGGAGRGGAGGGAPALPQVCLAAHGLIQARQESMPHTAAHALAFHMGPCLTPPPLLPPQVRPKLDGAWLGSDRVGPNGDLSVYWM